MKSNKLMSKVAPKLWQLKINMLFPNNAIITPKIFKGLDVGFVNFSEKPLVQKKAGFLSFVNYRDSMNNIDLLTSR